jgi:hypothetical protein
MLHKIDPLVLLIFRLGSIGTYAILIIFNRIFQPKSNSFFGIFNGRSWPNPVVQIAGK